MRSPLITAWRVLQYPIGLAVAALISVIVALILLSLHVPLVLMHAAVGFLGVFIGSLFFMPTSRFTGSIFLAVVGISFFYIRFVWYDVGPDSVRDGWLRLAFIATGALIAVVSHTAWHLFSRKGTRDNAA